VVEGKPVRAGAPADGTVLGTVTSASLAAVVGYVLSASDNNGAEALARLVAHDAGAPTTFAGAGAAVLAEVEALGVPTAGLRLSDGSGLADGSLLTPGAVARVLHAAASPDHPELRPLLTGLPVAGLTGTLVERFGTSSRATAGQGVVRAKTGSLNGVTTLAGTVVDADGRLLAFALMADEVPASQAGRAAADRAVAVIAACGCR
jgi:D-alanyl-D-alanine carboxypeptidase/D-alanyl-D-alanine-endopeptidase (penicillin-binding protein 4)